MKKIYNFKGIDKIFVENLNNLSESTKLKNLSNWDSKTIRARVFVRKKINKNFQ